MRNPNVNCQVCNKPLYRRPNELQKSKGKAYCSQSCYGESCRKPIPCLICGTNILAGKNAKTCSRACSNKQRIGMKYKLQDRIVKDKVKTRHLLKKRLIEERGHICERCGFDDIKILVVHHIIEVSNGGSDDLDNLELICPNCHAKIHYGE